jgi:hypothetical protein
VLAACLDLAVPPRTKAIVTLTLLLLQCCRQQYLTPCMADSPHQRQLSAATWSRSAPYSQTTWRATGRCFTTLASCVFTSLAKCLSAIPASILWSKGAFTWLLLTVPGFSRDRHYCRLMPGVAQRRQFLTTPLLIILSNRIFEKGHTPG